ncbi:MAG TPA: MaoC family dehydratase [Beijerinckiaceae bacterium]|jgi:3-hydroxybutyryl-CoA dehydratase|nr:MaoC family dehydratase [Beijerinckiaceae bacterium]
MNDAVASFDIGAEIAGPVRLMTAERIEWYDSAMLSAGKGELSQVGVNIHTDDEYAKAQGLPAIIADGMIMTNWCSSMMIQHFGMDYLEHGELRTKFIKPVYLGQTVHVRGRVLSADRSDGGVFYALDVWCEDENGIKVTDGDAKVEVRRR